MTFGEKFKAEREKRKQTQQEVADALGINRRMITRYENGISFPRTKDAYRKIAEYFKVDVNYLLTEDEEFVVQASEQYGSRGMKQAKDLIEGMSPSTNNYKHEQANFFCSSFRKDTMYVQCTTFVKR